MADISIREHEFQVAVVQSLAEIKGEVRHVGTRLDVLNGSVARHEARLGEVESTINAREASRVARDAERAQSERADDKRSARYTRFLFPILHWGLAALAALILEHGQDIVRIIQK